MTVIVVSYNSRLHLPACLTAVTRQDEVPTQVIVVDNASTDGSAGLVAAQFPTAQLVANQDNRGFATAVNQGLALARGKFLLLLNPDAALLPGALARLAGFLEAHPRAAAAGPRQWLDAQCTWQWSIVPQPPHWRLRLSEWPGLRRLGLARRQLARHWALNRAIWRSEQPQETPYLSGACLLLRRTALEAMGGLDEGYFLFFEDADLCDRLRAAGWTLHAVPSAGVVHAGMGSVRTAPDSGARHLLASGRRYLARHGDPLTHVLWTVVGLRRTRPSAHQAGHVNQPPSPATPAQPLRWPPAAGAASYWVEVAPDPAFLYAAATQVPQPVCTLPRELLSLAQGRNLFWRVAAIDGEGQLGPLSPTHRAQTAPAPENA